MRKRIFPLLLLLFVLPLGLATRKAPEYFPAFVAEYGGDTLWALVAFLLCWLLLMQWRLWLLVLLSGSFCLMIELSQLWQAAWLNDLRDTVFGALVLGRGFLWSDFVCYGVGIAMGIGLHSLHCIFSTAKETRE
jgi:hypothetical protein